MTETMGSVAGNLAVLLASAALSICGAALTFVIRIHGRVSSLETSSMMLQGWLKRVESKIDLALQHRCGCDACRS